MRIRLAMTLLGTVLLAPDGGVGGPVPGPGGGAPAAQPSPSAPAAPSPAPAAQPSAPAGAEPSPEPSVPHTSTQIGDIPSDIMALFDGVPFQGPSATPTSEPVTPQPGQTPQAVQPQPGATPGAQPQVPTPIPAGPVAPQPSGDPLATAIANLAENISRMPAGGQPQQPQGPQPDQVELPQHGYVFAIPDGLDTALVSDDPATRKTALGALVQGTARTIHTEVVKSMRAEFGRVLPSIVQQMMHSSRTQQNVAQDFYGTYKEFANPVFRPLVKQVAMQLVQETGAAGWTPDLRDKIAQRLRETLQGAGFVFGASGSVPQAPATPQAPIGPAAITPGGARPAVVEDPTRQFRDLL